MKKIELTQNKFAIVDDEDFEELNKVKWFAHNRDGRYYAGRYVNKVYIHMHKVVMNTKCKIDHKNHDTLDNRKENLRICLGNENEYNRQKSKGKSSKYKGVYFKKRDNKWYAKIGIDRKSIFIGSFKYEINAAKAYDKKARELFGEFAYTNFKEDGTQN